MTEVKQGVSRTISVPIRNDVPISLTDEQLAEYRQAFSLIDIDGNGAVSIEELGEVMRSLGWNPSEEELKSIIGEVDRNGNGAIDFQEFLDTLLMRRYHIEKEIEEAFYIFDKDAKGYITKDDIREVMHQLTNYLVEEDLEEILNAMGTDSNGRIHFENFSSQMKRNPLL